MVRTLIYLKLKNNNKTTQQNSWERLKNISNILDLITLL